MYTSRDLVHWSGPEHAFSMNNAWASGPAAEDREIHACDLVLHNGTFHLYWSVNHGPLRQIGHAVADTPLGPYREPVPEVPFDGRIDPQCFQDEDGRPLHIIHRDVSPSNIMVSRVGAVRASSAVMMSPADAGSVVSTNCI